jgi:hypothetical protein
MECPVGEHCQGEHCLIVWWGDCFPVERFYSHNGPLQLASTLERAWSEPVAVEPKDTILLWVQGL